MAPSTTGLLHPMELVDELTSESPYMKTGKKMAEVMKPGISKGTPVPFTCSFCTMAEASLWLWILRTMSVKRRRKSC